MCKTCYSHNRHTTLVNTHSKLQCFTHTPTGNKAHTSGVEVSAVFVMFRKFSFAIRKVIKGIFTEYFAYIMYSWLSKI